ncbi:hypothetical protein NYP18_09200 [Corynebacterium sp. YIM 101645]|uniref:Uncharacterized protein n=1 Tax=Corynebacterium lemuris TaxID=1859292 RepID=A0ABT2FX58_9CORY|nr:hypothetical protein [Corynebacterium lemuris]MCS5479835.1 hypothetical protein [Corynebacterium lemuris]
MALKRNPEWVSALEDSEVFVSFEDEPKIGLMGLMGAEWHTLGIQTDDGTVGLTRALDESTVNGMGFGVVARSFTPGAVSSTVDILEENAVTRHLAWPDNVVVNGVVIKRHTPRAARAHVAVVRKRENGVVSIEVSRYKAHITIPEQGRGREAAGRTVNIGYEIGPDKDVLEERFFKVEGGDVVELDPKIFVEDATITGDVAAGTAIQLGGAEGEEIAAEDTILTPSSTEPGA